LERLEGAGDGIGSRGIALALSAEGRVAVDWAGIDAYSEERECTGREKYF
jgi:hypothetical protein